MVPLPYREDIDTLRIVLYLLGVREVPPPDWIVRLLDLRLLDISTGAPGGYTASERGQRYLV